LRPREDKDNLLARARSARAAALEKENKAYFTVVKNKVRRRALEATTSTVHPPARESLSAKRARDEAMARESAKQARHQRGFPPRCLTSEYSTAEFGVNKLDSLTYVKDEERFRLPRGWWARWSRSSSRRAVLLGDWQGTRRLAYVQGEDDNYIRFSVDKADMSPLGRREHQAEGVDEKVGNGIIPLKNYKSEGPAVWPKRPRCVKPRAGWSVAPGESERAAARSALALSAAFQVNFPEIQVVLGEGETNVWGGAFEEVVCETEV